MTLEDYTNRFMKYYDGLMNAPQIAEEAAKKLEEAKNALASAQTTYEAAQKKAAEAATVLRLF